LLISNHNSFTVPFDKIALVCFIRKIYLYFSVGDGQPREPALCQLYRHTFVPHGDDTARLFPTFAPSRIQSIISQSLTETLHATCGVAARCGDASLSAACLRAGQSSHGQARILTSRHSSVRRVFRESHESRELSLVLTERFQVAS